MNDEYAWHAWQFIGYVYYEDEIRESWHNYVTGEREERSCQ